MSLSMFREAVAATNARLKDGEKPAEVPCPKCGQERGIALEVTGEVPTKFAVCGICAFHWVVT